MAHSSECTDRYAQKVLDTICYIVIPPDYRLYNTPLRHRSDTNRTPMTPYLLAPRFQSSNLNLEESVMLFVSYSPLCASFHRRLTYSLLVALFGLPVAAQSVSITSPANNSSGISAVRITASTTGWISSDHLEIWDNNTKLGNVFASSVNNVIVLPNGSHSTTVNLVNSSGSVVAGSSVNYQVAENCINSSTEQCNFDHQAIDN